MLPAIIWLTVLTATVTTFTGARERVEVVVGGATEAECQEARENVKVYGRPAAALGALVVHRLRATPCVPMVIEALDEDEALGLERVAS